MRTWCLIPLLSATLWACEDRGIDVGPPSAFDYSIDQSISCFCPQSGVRVRIFAQSDTIADLVYLADNSHVPRSFWGRYRTIKGLFDEIKADNASAFFVEVTMDSSNTYPAIVSVRPNAGILDAGFVYQTSNLVDLK